jgi:hypothetical protein
MHDKQWGTGINSWKSQGTTSKSKTWADSSTKLTTPRSISTAATTDQPTISYDPYLSTHVFKKVNEDAPNPTDNIWIGTSHVFYPLSGAQNATAGQDTMTKSMTNTSEGKQ